MNGGLSAETIRKTMRIASKTNKTNKPHTSQLMVACLLNKNTHRIKNTDKLNKNAHIATNAGLSAKKQNTTRMRSITNARRTKTHISQIMVACLIKQSKSHALSIQKHNKKLGPGFAHTNPVSFWLYRSVSCRSVYQLVRRRAAPHGRAGRRFAPPSGRAARVPCQRAPSAPF